MTDMDYIALILGTWVGIIALSFASMYFTRKQGG